MRADAIPPKYKARPVERVILQEAIELHPQQLTVGALALRIVADPSDRREVQTATRAIRSLRQVGLIDYRADDELVEPTPAALHAHALLAG
ncbi:MAG: hypothetical protein WA687_14615 [Solirubrobacterales bacterium]